MVCKNIMNPIAIIVAIVVIAGVTGGVAYFAGLGSEPDDELLSTWKWSLEHCQGIESIGGVGSQLAQYRHAIDELEDEFEDRFEEIPEEIKDLVGKVLVCMHENQNQFGFG